VERLSRRLLAKRNFFSPTDEKSPFCASYWVQEEELEIEQETK
jgi:hypothetical protein